MREPHQLKHENRQRVVTFKRNAHLCTLISSLWTVFTLLGIYLFKQHGDPDHQIEALFAIGIWVLHAAFIGLSVYYWKTERESVLMVETDEDEGD